VDLFAAAPAIESIADSAVEAWAKTINPDELSPREALEALYQLKKLGSLP
jgi:DNA mismatch repair protein MutS